MEYDFADDLRGDDEGPMNVKETSPIAAIIVGVIVGGSVVFLDRIVSRDDTPTVTAIAKLETTVAQLAEQVRELKGYPYVRREEFSPLQDRVSGLEKRVDYWEQRPGR